VFRNMPGSSRVSAQLLTPRVEINSTELVINTSKTMKSIGTLLQLNILSMLYNVITGVRLYRICELVTPLFFILLISPNRSIRYNVSRIFLQ
jgi:hypothetical protein